MLDKQVQLKHNREKDKRISEVKEDILIATIGKPKIHQITAYTNKTVDCLPHEWNEPGMRYLRKSLSSMENPNNKVANPPSSNLFALNKSMDHSLSVYNEPFSLKGSKLL